jgi:hypothetical protein
LRERNSAATGGTAREKISLARLTVPGAGKAQGFGKPLNGAAAEQS